MNNRIERLGDFDMQGSFNLKDLQASYRKVEVLAETVIHEMKRQMRLGYEKIQDMKDSFGIARFLMKNFDDLDNPVSLTDLSGILCQPPYQNDQVDCY
ncbi:MAG: hypothetical protein IPG53_09795 [Ignavibacteriales bacterium]|nr:hypothetical protein [Ignavibacteriales bacterium]